MEKGEKLTGGPYWTQNWIEAMWRFTAERFVDFDTGTVDFEALGREEYEFRKALFFRNFKNSPRARDAFDAAADDYCKKVANGQKGGRPKKSTQDAPNGNAGEFKSDSGDAGNLESATSCDTFTADGETREGSQGIITGAAITRNEPLEHDHLEPSATISQDAEHRKASDDRKAPTSCTHYDQETCQVSTDEARESQALESRRTEGHSLRVGNVARPSVRSPGRKFRNKEEFIQWAIDTGLDPVDANECWEATEERGGKDADGNTVKNMKAYVRRWCATRAEKRRTA